MKSHKVMDTCQDNESTLLLSGLGEIMQLAEQIERLTQNRNAFNDTKLNDE